MVGLNGLEPTTSPLSGVRSNHLSYRPVSIECSYIIPLLFSCVNKVFIIFIIMIIELCNPVILPMQPIVDPVLQAYFMMHTHIFPCTAFPSPTACIPCARFFVDASRHTEEGRLLQSIVFFLQPLRCSRSFIAVCLSHK